MRKTREFYYCKYLNVFRISINTFSIDPLVLMYKLQEKVITQPVVAGLLSVCHDNGNDVITKLAGSCISGLITDTIAAHRANYLDLVRGHTSKLIQGMLILRPDTGSGFEELI